MEIMRISKGRLWEGDEEGERFWEMLCKPQVKKRKK
jgi:hypothetical protein